MSTPPEERRASGSNSDNHTTHSAEAASHNTQSSGPHNTTTTRTTTTTTGGTMVTTNTTTTNTTNSATNAPPIRGVSVCISHIPSRLSARKVIELFQGFRLEGEGGNVVMARPFNRERVGYVSLLTRAEAEAAVSQLYHRPLRNRTISLHICPREEHEVARARMNMRSKRIAVYRLRGLPYSATVDDVRAFLTTLGEDIRRIDMCRCADGAHNGTCFVEMYAGPAQAAIDRLNRHRIGGRIIEVHSYTTKMRRREMHRAAEFASLRAYREFEMMHRRQSRRRALPPPAEFSPMSSVSQPQAQQRQQQQEQQPGPSSCAQPGYSVPLSLVQPAPPPPQPQAQLQTQQYSPFAPMIASSTVSFSGYGASGPMAATTTAAAASPIATAPPPPPPPSQWPQETLYYTLGPAVSLLPGQYPFLLSASPAGASMPLGAAQVLQPSQQPPPGMAPVALAPPTATMTMTVTMAGPPVQNYVPYGETTTTATTTTTTQSSLRPSAMAWRQRVAPPPPAHRATWPLPPRFFIRLRNLPEECTYEQVVQFLKTAAVVPGAVYAVNYPRVAWSGEAFVEVVAAGDINRALMQHRYPIGDRRIDVAASSPAEFERYNVTQLR